MGQPYSLLATPYSLLQPCRCLCRALVQTTYTRPLRRTILQCSQIRLTLVRTFMAHTSRSRLAKATQYIGLRLEPARGPEAFSATKKPLWHSICVKILSEQATTGKAT